MLVSHLKWGRGNIYIYTFIRHEDRIQHSTEIKTDRQRDRHTNITADTSA